MSYKSNIKFVRQHGARVKRFSEMTMPYKMSMAWYMAFDGEAWNLLGKLDNDDNFPSSFSSNKKKDEAQTRMLKLMKQEMPLYVEEYGREKFGVGRIPTGQMLKYFWEYNTDSMRDEFETWEAYHAWYRKNCGIPKHGTRSRWTCIMSGMDDELLQDGWHRFHSYVSLGCRDIPIIYYV